MSEQPQKKMSEWAIAGYGLGTFLFLGAMRKIFSAFTDGGLIDRTGFVQDVGDAAGSDLFIPVACATAFIPLAIKLASTIRRKYTKRRHHFADEGWYSEYVTELVDTDRQNEIQSDGVSRHQQDTAR